MTEPDLLDSPRDREGDRRRTVLIAGGGFSGLLTALHLLSDPAGPQVRLVERRGVFGRGRAYATDDPDHLLNVRVANMSAFPDQPDHFVRWLAARNGESGAGAFVTRGVYGEYLQSLLRAAVAGRFGVDRLLLEGDEVVDLTRANGRWRAEMAMGRVVEADAVVLATGAPPSSPPTGASAELLASDRYVGDPWRAQGLDAELGPRVLMLGTGLTMVDVALMLGQADRGLVAISRRGLTPRGHDGAPPVAGRIALGGSPAEILREIRRRSRADGWRAVVDRLRGSSADIWRGWSLAQRRQFLRHARPWWDVHRHRMAPPVAARIEEMTRRGELLVRAGTIVRLDLDGDEVRAEFRPRGGRSSQTLRFDTVVNCMGLGGDIERTDQPLMQALSRRSLVRADPCLLGLDVDPGLRPLSSRGAETPGLFAVGPITRGGQWETTSVPDIRSQARDVAAAVAALLR